MITAYLVRVKNRTLETEPQKQIQDRTLFYSKAAADEFRRAIIARPVSFMPSQIGVYEIELTVLGEVSYDDFDPSGTTHCQGCRREFASCRCTAKDRGEKGL